MATALIGPLAWEPPYAMGAALKRQKDPQKKKKKIWQQINQKTTHRNGNMKKCPFSRVIKEIQIKSLSLSKLVKIKHEVQGYEECTKIVIHNHYRWEINPAVMKKQFDSNIF